MRLLLSPAIRITVWIILLIAWANTSNAGGTGIAAITGQLKDILPKDSPAACLVNKLDDSVGLSELGTGDVAFGNVGANINNRKRLDSSPCLSTLTKRLFDEVRKQNGSYDKRPSLADTAGQGEGKMKSGWMWDLAKKYAGGSPRLAMMMLDMCMNDDFNSGHKTKGFPTKELDDGNRRVQDLRRQIDSTQEELRDPSLRDDEKDLLIQKISNLTREANSLKQKNDGAARNLQEINISCPSKTGAAYLPGNLGAGADIPADIKDRISKLQGVDKDLIAAKYYHVYSSAAVACRLTECKSSPALITNLQDRLAQAYRGMSLCEALRDRDATRSKFTEKFGKDVLSDANWKKLTEQVATSENVHELLPCSGMAKWCAQLSRSENPNQRREMMTGLRTALDAGTMYNDGAFRVKIGSVETPCTFDLYSGPRLDMDPEAQVKTGLLDRLMSGNACKQSGWSEDRCEGAIKRLRTWEVDETWTRLQHIRGSKFGQQACGSEPPLSNPESQACDALKKIEAGEGQATAPSTAPTGTK